MLKIEASDIYEVPLTKKHDTEKRERFKKALRKYFYCTIIYYEFSPKSINYVPPFPSLSNSFAASRPVAYQVFIGYDCISLFVHISGQTTSLNAI